MEFLVASLIGVLKIYVLFLAFVLAAFYYENAGTTFRDALRKSSHPYVLVSMIIISTMGNYILHFEFDESGKEIIFVLPVLVGSMLVSVSWSGVLGLELSASFHEDFSWFAYFEQNRKVAVVSFMIGMVLVISQFLIDAERILFNIEEFYSYP